MSDYKATDNDLPAGFFDQPVEQNQLSRARDRIRVVAGEMGFTLDAEQIELFAILLIGLEER